ncbi:MAG: cytochrome P450 [Paludibaculum sp.]
MDDCIAIELPARRGDSLDVDANSVTTRITMDVIRDAGLGTHFAGGSRCDFGCHPRDFGAGHCGNATCRRAPDRLPRSRQGRKLRHLQTIDTLIARHVAARAAQRDQQRTGDVLGMMLAARDADRDTTRSALSPREVHDNCIVLFGAGFDTSSSALAWWIGLMALHRDVADQVRRETAGVDDVTRLPLLNATLKEALRLSPALRRTCSAG